MSGLRVAMVLNSLGRGGVPAVALQFLGNLPTGGIEPFLYVLKDDAHASDRDRLADGLRRQVVELAIGDRRAGKLERIAELARWLGERRIDILHTHSYRPNVFGRMAGLLERPRGLRMIAHYHNDYDDKWQADAAMLALERSLARSTDALVAVSVAVRDHVAMRLECRSERLEVIANAVAVERYRGGCRESARRALGIAPDRFMLAVIGRICEQKGQADLIEALPWLSGVVRPLVLMAGDIEDKALFARLQERSRAIGWHDDIRFLGHHEDMAGLLAAADAVVAPSRWEGMPLTLLEAMAAGRPIVACAIPSIVETTGADAAMLVAPRDPAAMAQAINRLIGDAGLRQALTTRGSARVDERGWAPAARQLAELYRRVGAG